MKNTAKTILSSSMTFFAAQFAAAVPIVDNVDMNQAFKRVDITYTLSEEPAVITLEVQTNANTSASADDQGWTSIGGAAVSNAKGDVWKVVEPGTRTITWRPDYSWPGHKIADGGARAVVTAWSLDNTPDYMVVDVSAAAKPDTQTYYPGVDFLPGGLLGNPDYRTTKLVMRKIMAKDVEWTMGSTSSETGRSVSERTHLVTLTNNYYIGVFMITQSQWGEVATNSTQKARHITEGAMRPMEQVSYNEIRNAANSSTANTAYNWPAAPNPSSFLGLLRSKTGIGFDLPSEAQWEFAARAGHGSGYWGDGSAIQNTSEDENLNRMGRYMYNGGKIGESFGTNPPADCGVTNGTAIVGTYEPNDWGLYDMCGNLWEWCLDWYESDNATKTDSSGKLYAGRVNINPLQPSQTLSGVEGTARVLRGGGWGFAADVCRPAKRGDRGPSARYYSDGFRVVCPLGL